MDLIYIPEWILIDAMVTYIFYKSILAFFIMLPFGMVFFQRKKQEADKRRKAELSGQFRESIIAVSAALNAGYSVENAFIETYHDMVQMYGKEALISQEFLIIKERLKSNETIEKILADFAAKYDIEDIYDFADVFSAAKRSGGDMIKIIKHILLITNLMLS